jgi:hypothetical protein
LTKPYNPLAVKTLVSELQKMAGERIAAGGGTPTEVA